MNVTCGVPGCACEQGATATVPIALCGRWPVGSTRLLNGEAVSCTHYLIAWKGLSDKHTCWVNTKDVRFLRGKTDLIEHFAGLHRLTDMCFEFAEGGNSIVIWPEDCLKQQQTAKKTEPLPLGINLPEAVALPQGQLPPEPEQDQPANQVPPRKRGRQKKQ